MCFLILLINVMFLNLLLNSKCESLSKLPSFGCAQRISYEYLVRTENLTAEGNKTFTQGEGKVKRMLTVSFFPVQHMLSAGSIKFLPLSKRKRKQFFHRSTFIPFPYTTQHICVGMALQIFHRSFFILRSSPAPKEGF